MSDHYPITIPEGLNELLQEFALSVLRKKPEDLVDYAAYYFTDLKEKKQGNGNEVGQMEVSEENNSSLLGLTADPTTLLKDANGDMDTLPSDDDDEAATPVRFDRGRRCSVFAEPFSPSDEDELQKICYPKSDEQRGRLCEAFSNCFLFKNLEPEQKTFVLDAMFEKTAAVGDHLIEQGDDGDFFYIIEKGFYEVYINDKSTSKLVSHYDNEGSFGELALLYNTPRKATVVAKTAGTLWALDRMSFRRIVMESASKKRKMYEKFLVSIPMLSSLDNYERMNIADALRREEYSDGDLIIQQGDTATEFYLMVEGEVAIRMRDKEGSDEEVDISVVSVGGYFGELALLVNKPRAASVYAQGRVVCAALDIGAFERLLGPCVEIMKRNFENYEQQLIQLLGSTMDILKTD
ncbi:CAMP-dependent protein kinase II-alpha regulatory subunit [Oopsacas minuta]|uniref:cAMP-dependent protein kinase type II regulatory subunit n=1 Tax=Oopsacas minuta TaxID=111878 RepID=A0AAV7JCP8_9METZ|nr:CAMP-dependent protein kinase II-alpha regulatory subunit [Oopsacas minuta]